MRRGLAGLALVGLMIGAPIAGAAELSDVVLRIEASSGRAEGYVEFTQADGWWEGDTFYWQTDEDIPIVDPDSGEVIGTFLADAGVSSYVVPEDWARSHPQVNLGFAMSAGVAPTTFTVRSALLSFSPMTNPDARADCAINITDVTGDMVQLDGAGPTGGAFLSQYNGAVPNGTTFDESITQIVGGLFETVTGDSDTDWVTVSDTLSDISTQISFMLTAGDSASGTSAFQVVPEPTGMLLVLAGLTLVLRRR
jgi:hypothetical protein